MADYPFTTLEPNSGITFFRTPCLCAKSDEFTCSPKYDRCEKGDIPGLIPGAHSGLGLGNQFLDSLRKADLFLHVLDASGKTNEKGESADGYDCSQDVAWIENEIIQWIFGNVWGRWRRIRKMLTMRRYDDEDILVKYLSGYSCNRKMIQHFMKEIKYTSPTFFLRHYRRKNEGGVEEDDFEEEEESEKVFSSDAKKNQGKKKKKENQIDEEVLLKQEKFGLINFQKGHVYEFIRQFVKLRFPTVLVLNKVDCKGCEKNIMQCYEKFPSMPSVPCSALSELFLKRLKEKGKIDYVQGSNDFKIVSLQEGEKSDSHEKSKKKEKQLRKKLKKIKEMVLEEYDNTGCFESVKAALNLIDPIIVKPIFQTGKKKESKKLGDFWIMKRGMSVGEALDVFFKGDKEEEKGYKVESVGGLTLSGAEKVEDHQILVLRKKR